MTDGWEGRAAAWMAWARTPGHDAYWDYRDAFFALLPEPAGRALDVGCGEGRVTRDLAGRGHRMTALDASPSLVAAAAERDPDSEYLVGDAAALPFEEETFSLVVSYNMLMDVGDMPRVVAEAARVLAPGGRLCVCVTHPFADAGAWDGEDPDARFVVSGTYLGGGAFRAAVTRDGLDMTFDGQAYPLERYARALEAAGLLIEAAREPAGGSDRPEDQRWRRVPMFLMLRCLKPR